MSKTYPVQEIWRFYYQGTHSHPVRRTVAIIEVKNGIATGYELRQGNTVRARLGDAPVKSYKVDKIAKIGQLDARRPLRRETSPAKANRSTLSKGDVMSLLVQGA